jgi:hypothetical protein
MRNCGCRNSPKAHSDATADERAIDHLTKCRGSIQSGMAEEENVRITAGVE